MSEGYWQNLGRRAVSCKAWRWMPGMRDAHGGRLGAETDAGFYWLRPFGDDVDSPDFPDLRDPATMGCLRQLVLDAWDVETVEVSHSSEWKEPHMFLSRWSVGRFNVYSERKSEGEFCHDGAGFDHLYTLGLLAALEAAL